MNNQDSGIVIFLKPFCENEILSHQMQTSEHHRRVNVVWINVKNASLFFTYVTCFL